MGTRSTTKVYDGDHMVLALYCQYDGYPSGVGQQLVEFIKSKPFVNGIYDDENVFNGIGCFSAQLVAHLKRKAGLWYITGNEMQNEEFNYEIRLKYDENWQVMPPLFICDGYGKRFEGSPFEFETWYKGNLENE